MEITMLKSKREELIKKRKEVYGPNGAKKDVIDFAPSDGKCWSCGIDLVEFYGDDYPTVYISGCRKCHRSYCD